jgi:tyrosyl-tRNA synthetase
MIGKYYRLASTLDLDQVDAIDASLADGTADPYELKRALARNICDLYHGAGAGEDAEAAFDRQFKEGQTPDDIPTVSVDLSTNDEGKVYLARVLADAGLAKSAGEARRLIDGGGVKVNGEKVEPKAYNVEAASLAGATIQVGKLHFARLS